MNRKGRLLVGILLAAVLTGCAEKLPSSTSADAVVESTKEAVVEEGDKKEVQVNMNPEMEALTASELVENLRIGWNLGNTLDSTNSSLLKTSMPNLWETAWGNPVVTKELIKSVVDSGFNVIRIPVSWNDHILIADNYKIEEKWLARVKEVVDYAYDQGVYVILNAHHESWYYPYYDNKENGTKMMESIWAQIAECFQDYDEHLIFEGMNEPRKIGTSMEWNGGDQEGWDMVNHFNSVFIDTVRNSSGNNPYRILMIPSYAANCWEAIKHLEIPADDKLIVSVHAYEPYDFALNLTGRTTWDQDTKTIDTIMDSLEELFISKGIPVILGEFGAVSKPVEGNEADRAAWAEYYVKAAADKGIPCIWWDNGLTDGDGERLGLFDRNTNAVVYPLILDGLMKGSAGRGNETGAIDYEAGMVNRGNWSRIKSVMEKAEAGEAVTVGFLGGSITQGSLSSTPDTCYAHLVYEWWKEKFPKSEVTYVNAGIGGTTSQFGVARVQSDLLDYNPDFVVVEFSVNDENTPFYRETYEGLVRNLYKEESNPGILLFHNVMYNNGYNVQAQHQMVGKAYELPCVSMMSSLYPLVKDGVIPNRDVTPDDLHPNDAGHRILADQVIYFLEEVYGDLGNKEEQASFQGKRMPEPITQDGFENSVRYQNYNSTPKLNGFVADTEKQNGITDIFKNGWTADQVGDSITFEIDASSIAIQFRKSVKQPTCIATVTIDNDTDHAVTLDGNFEETWGDCLYLTTVASHIEKVVHTVRIEITEAHEEDKVPFYLVSVIGADKE